MKLHEIEIDNFRCFGHFEADLEEDFTLFIGENGTGKSALLDAIAVAIGSWLIGFPETTARSIHDDEIRHELHDRDQGAPNLERMYPVGIRARGTILGQELSWARTLERRGGRTTYGQTRRLRKLAEMAYLLSSSDRSPIKLPVLAYYGAGRLWVQKRESSLKEAALGSRLNGYIDCLDPASNHKLFEAWMRWREHERLQRVAKLLEAQSPGTDSVRMPEVEAVRRAVTTCIENAGRLVYDMRYEELHIELNDGSVLPFRMLSDGYRNFLGMVADLAWRTVQLNPDLGENAPLETPGVVLIDEIDLHLHPRWQRRIVDDLRRAFPEVQFIATTHSPQVVSTTRRSNMRLLVPGQSMPLAVGHVEGRDSNAILEDIMGVPARPEWMVKELERLARLIDDGHLQEARALVDELAEQHLGENDRAIIDARWELHDPAAQSDD